MRYMLLALALLPPLDALAASATVTATWTAPTAREDGSPITAADLSGYELSYAVDGGKPVVIAISGGTVVTKGATLMLAGRAAPYVTTWSVVAIDSAGLRSKPSTVATVNIDVPQSPLAAPRAVSVRVSCSNGACSVSAAAQ